MISDVGLGLAAVGAPHSVAPPHRGRRTGASRRRRDDSIWPPRWRRRSASPTADQRGPADYKRALAGELTKRALRTAIARCRGEEA